MEYLYLPFCTLAIAVVFMYFEHKEKHTLAVVLKGLASLSFVLFGYLSGKSCSDQTFANTVLVGLILGCIADVLLNLRFVFKKKGQLVFLLGILVFLAGHVAYIVALFPKCGYVAACLIIGILLSALLLKWIFGKIEAKKAFKIFGVFYLGAIVIMNCIAVGVLITMPHTGSVLFALGALSFLISDIVLILNTFGKKTRTSLRITNLLFYYIGQILIACSLQFF